jgi:drug/metabolite transporter (DMT)-like permease
MVLLGLMMMGAGYGFQYWGEQYVSSGLAGVLFATAPIFVVVFAHILIQDEKITRWKALGIAISFGGTVVIFWRGLTLIFGSDIKLSLFGALAEVASAAVTALAIVVYKRFYAEIDRAANLLVQTIVGSAFLLILGVVFERSSSLDFTPLAIVAIVYLGLVSAFPFIGYYWLLEGSSVISASMITFVTPVLALILGWILLGEPVSTYTIVGGALILIGVYLTAGFVRR